MKPILIDALHINMGGALMILNHLLDCLVRKNVDFVLLKDMRCPRYASEEKIANIVVMSCAEKTRRSYYKEHRNDFSCILCLGNIPPSIKMPVPVHTYIHNVSLLEIPVEYIPSWKFKAYIKRAYVRLFAPNTDYWIVQTENTANLVKKFLPPKKIYIYPFYYIPEYQSNSIGGKRRDYVFVGEHTYAKGHTHLIKAWTKLSEILRDACPVLHLTVASKDLLPVIEEAVRRGANICNHGRIPFNEVVDLYKRCKATVYPSLNESLGLGIIEAVNMGCDVIGSDLPYIYSVCNPSGVFIPRNSESIVQAVLKYEEGKSKKTYLTIKDKASELVDYLLNHREL